jgi:ribonuclease HII
MKMNKLQRHDALELENADYLIGLDEAGRGCLAGPVTAGACVLSEGFFENVEVLKRSASINDSKQLSATAREAQFETMVALKAEGWLDFAVAEGSVAVIAEHNILGATRVAMQSAVEALQVRAKDWELPLAAASGPLFDAEANLNTRLLVDGRALKPFPYVHTALVKGDSRSLVIAMASIAAKVSRDRVMKKLDKKYPEYDFAQNKGYGTAAHRKVLSEKGACPAHRELFLRKVLF